MICAPNELLVISGRPHHRSDGSVVGYRLVRGGRAIILPLLESVGRMDLSNMSVAVDMRNVLSRGGRLLPILKIDPREPQVHDAVERFLNIGREDLSQVANDTLEGVVRNVLVRHDPDEVMYAREKLTNEIIEEAEQDFSKLGLLLDTLKVQRLGDEVGTYRR